MQNSQEGLIIDYLISASIKEIGLSGLRAMLPEANLSPEDLKNYIIQLEKFKDNGQDLARTMKMSYAYLSNEKKLLVDTLYEGKLSQEEFKSMEDSIEMTEGRSYLEYSLASNLKQKNLNYLYKSNQTKRFLVEDYRIIVTNAGKEYCNKLSELDSRNFDSLQSMGPLLIFTDNPMGKILHTLMQGSFTGTNYKKCNENFSIAGTETLMALKAYKVENGELPISLENLVPAYLPEVPRDYFDGNPIRYSPEKKIIYSVGQDLKDSGGSANTKEGSEKTDDISYKIEF